MPANVIKHSAAPISIPLTDIINSAIVKGQWPDLWKEESLTPIPKVHPPNNIDDLRNISGLKNLNKVTEKLFAEMMLSDMKQHLDKSQYGNKKGVSIQHYLVKFIDKVLVSLDRNSKDEIFAGFATFIDWKQAFNRQDPKLGIKSFIKNGVGRPLFHPSITIFKVEQCTLNGMAKNPNPEISRGEDHRVVHLVFLNISLRAMKMLTVRLKIKDGSGSMT